MKSNIEINKLKSVNDKLNKYNHLAKDDDYITVTEWANGEGWDIDLNGKLMQLGYEELEAINYLTKVLTYE